MVVDGGSLLIFAAGIFVGALVGIGISNHVHSKKEEQEAFDKAKEHMDVLDDLDKATYLNDKLQREVDDLKTKFEAAKDAAKEYTSDDIFDSPEATDHSNGDPIVISENDFLYRYPHTQCHALSFYRGDEILVNDEENEPIADPDAVMGEEVMWALKNTEDDVLYAYNPSLEMTYEIDIIEDNYIDGFDEEDE